ncbi:hypothetical protein GCM10009570_19540 [Dietzia natronolimnaea]
MAAPALIWSLISPETFFFFGGIVFLILRLDLGSTLYTWEADCRVRRSPQARPSGRACGGAGTTLESLRAINVQRLIRSGAPWRDPRNDGTRRARCARGGPSG